MAYSSFKFNLGDVLQLQYVDEMDRDRKYVKLIGCLPEQSLIVTAPSHEGKMLFVREDQLFVVRMFSDNTVQGFTARVLKTHHRPYPHFHLSFPADCESQVVRKAHRVDLNMIISMQTVLAGNVDLGNQPEKISAKLTNLSTAGAQVNSKKMLGKEGDTVTLSMKLTIGGIEKYLNLPAQIKRIKILDEEKSAEPDISYGIQFLPLEDDETVVLHGFVYESLIKG